MIYTKPEKVLSPRNSLEIVKILCDKGKESYSVAELKWCGKKCFGFRWNITQNEWNNKSKQQELTTCIGMPSSRGHSVWFILPDEINDYIQHLI